MSPRHASGWHTDADTPTRRALLRVGGFAGTCLPVGEHTFVTRYRVEGTGDAAEEGTTDEWGFTVLLA